MTPKDLAKAALRSFVEWYEDSTDTRPPVERAREALSALEAEGADGWRPIESALRGDTEMLGVDSQGRQCVFHWLADIRCYETSVGPGRWLTEEIDNGCWVNAHDVFFDPTHWRPLPPSPALADDQGEGL